METNFSVGDKIQVSEFYQRRRGAKNRKEWNINTKETPFLASVIGIRTLSNGDSEYECECGYIYIATEHFKALLVVKNIHSKPFYIPIPK
jgi:hypothetical protein